MTTDEDGNGRQPRERPVPCMLCGWYRGKPVTMTLNLSALCDEHERSHPTAWAVRESVNPH